MRTTRAITRDATPAGGIDVMFTLFVARAWRQPMAVTASRYTLDEGMDMATSSCTNPTAVTNTAPLGRPCMPTVRKKPNMGGRPTRLNVTLKKNAKATRVTSMGAAPLGFFIQRAECSDTAKDGGVPCPRKTRKHWGHSIESGACSDRAPTFKARIRWISF
jgi:hypothetical protein